MICETIWTNIGVSELADKCTICKMQYRIPVGCGTSTQLKGDYGSRGQPSSVVIELMSTTPEP